LIFSPAASRAPAVADDRRSPRVSSFASTSSLTRAFPPSPHPRITRAPHRSRGYSATLLDTPRRFYAALRASRVPNVEASFGDETRLILYALQSQAERGPCEPRSKWGMAAEERAKHETWANLGKMEPFEAMRLFVKLLDDERPGWWKEDAGAPGGGTSASVRAGPGGAAETDTRREEETRVIVSPVRAVARNHSRAGESRARGGDDSRDDDDDDGKIYAWVSNLKRGVWVTNPGSKTENVESVCAPPPRYRHASCVLGDELLVFGGADARGRLCKGADLFFVLNARTGAWRSVATRRARPCAGARLVAFGGNAYLVGGEVEKPDDDDDDDDDDEDDAFLDVSRIDFSTDASTGSETATFVALNATAAAGTRKPRRRRGHTATVVPGTDTLVVFGGEDDSRRFLNDARVLDMRALTWRTAYEGESAPAGFFGGLFFGAAGGKTPEDPRAPAPRAEHVAAAMWARNDAFEETRETRDEDEDDASRSTDSARATLLVLGGAGASGACFDDAYALDIATGRWTVLALDAYAAPADGADGPGKIHAESSGIQSYKKDKKGNVPKAGPGARAGHASCVFLGRYLCVAGGGNDTAERGEYAEASVLDLRSMAWLAPPRAFAAPPGAGEGMSLCPLERGGDACLVAFGGYDGTCRGETHALRVPAAFLDGDEGGRTRVEGVNKNEKNALNAFFARGAPPGGARRSLFGRLLDPGPGPGPATTSDERARGGSSVDERAAAAAEPPSRVEVLAQDNLRLRQENARLTEIVSSTERTSAAMRARAEASEKRAAEADAALASARSAVAALETRLSDERAARRNERDLAAKELEASQKKAGEWRAKAGGGEEQDTKSEEEESDKEEEDPESRRGWLFGL